MQVMNFILNCLLPNSAIQGQGGSETQKVLEQTLVHIIDKGCTNSSGLSAQSSFSSSTSTMNLSRYCFNNMFELCRYSPAVAAQADNAAAATSPRRSDMADA